MFFISSIDYDRNQTSETEQTHKNNKNRDVLPISLARITDSFLTLPEFVLLLADKIPTVPKTNSALRTDSVFEMDSAANSEIAPTPTTTTLSPLALAFPHATLETADGFVEAILATKTSNAPLDTFATPTLSLASFLTMATENAPMEAILLMFVFSSLFFLLVRIVDQRD